MSQERAPTGGTYGANGEFYEGGKFLPHTEAPSVVRGRRASKTTRPLPPIVVVRVERFTGPVGDIYHWANDRDNCAVRITAPDGRSQEKCIYGAPRKALGEDGEARFNAIWSDLSAWLLLDRIEAA